LVNKLLVYLDSFFLITDHTQNKKLLKRVRSGEYAANPLVYGDVVQLEHLRSGCFVKMLKTPAPRNHNGKMVTLVGLKESGVNCRFRIVPRFKARSKGTSIYAGGGV
jgi:hypothetical protein